MARMTRQQQKAMFAKEARYNPYYVGSNLKGFGVKVYDNPNQNERFFKKAYSDSEAQNLSEYRAMEQVRDLVKRGYDVKAIKKGEDKYDIWYWQD